MILHPLNLLVRFGEDDIMALSERLVPLLVHSFLSVLSSYRSSSLYHVVYG